LIVKSRDAPDTVFAGYLANPNAGYRIFSRISGKGRIRDIRPDTGTWLHKYIFGKISNEFFLNGFDNYRIL
jgi:hypothetical protein